MGIKTLRTYTAELSTSEIEKRGKEDTTKIVMKWYENHRKVLILSEIEGSSPRSTLVQPGSSANLNIDASHQTMFAVCTSSLKVKDP